jgi:hypothetical protein
MFFVAFAIVTAFGTAASVVGYAIMTPVAAQDNMSMTMADNAMMGNMTGENMIMGDNMTMGG